MIGFVYDLSDTQDGIKCLRMGFIFCGKHLLLMTRVQVSYQGPMGPLILSIDGHMKKTSGSPVDLRVLYVQESNQEKVWCCRLGYYCSMALVGI